MTPVPQLATHGLIAILVTACALTGYDRLVAQPRQIIGVVDLAEVYRAKEDEFTRRLTSARTEEERQAALDMARAFSRQLPAALAALPAECGCPVMLKSAVAGPAPRMVDLTALLRQRVEAP
ncbi:hypothetical protein [Thauera sp. Sel9]|uniref:hypothetical protein n=1 Tax=Thauera sp. Sel9 TaxID=2974299 RepID=UPI0021E12E0A|nr:hypothetical protein [Thauera sp. Sel9]MCV2219850.1 hypothetical protein [Thauera sp. Sel9]